MRNRLLPALVVLLASTAPLAETGTPIVMTHNGYLLDAQDRPVEEPALALSFSIWDDVASPAGSRRVFPTTGSATCTVNVSKGFFAVALGTAGCMAGLTAEMLPPFADRYLELSINNSPMSPRLRIGLVPNAAIAATALDARKLDGQAAADFHDAAQLTGTVPAQALGNAVLGVEGVGPIDVLQNAGIATISAATATSTTDGVLTAADFSTFSNKLALVAHDGSLAGDGTPASPLSLVKPVYAPSLGGDGTTDSPFGVVFGNNGSSAARGDDPRFIDPRPPTGAASGDLLGTFPGPSVAKLLGRPLDATAPLANQVLQWDGNAWKPGTVVSEAPGFTSISAATLGQYYVSNAFAPKLTQAATALLVGDATATLVRNGTDSGLRALVLNPDDSIAVRMRASTANDQLVSVLLAYGSASATFGIATAPDVVPDPFTFASVTGAALDTDVTSAQVTLAGFTVSLSATVTGAASAVLLKNGTPVGATTTVVAGDKLSVRLRASAGYSTTTSVTVTVGTETTTWAVTTVAQCAPGKREFNYTGGAQDFPVPAGCTRLTVKAWGAGGGSNRDVGSGGAGGFSSGQVTVSGGEVLSVIVGGGGSGNSNLTGGAGGFGGGGAGGNSSNYGAGGGGGGRSAVRRGTTELLTAGGGGGGADDASGEAGGGLSGVSACGQGGTQTAGGAGTNPGTAFQGGSSTTMGGGGGGGYFGGGACASWSGGGGGSGFIPSGGTTTAGGGRNPPNTSDVDYVGGIGVGAQNGGQGECSGCAGSGRAGAPGRVVISW